MLTEAGHTSIPGKSRWQVSVIVLRYFLLKKPYALAVGIGISVAAALAAGYQVSASDFA
jgi:hypothetical protein